MTTQGDIVWVYPAPDAGDTRFIFQLRRGLEKRVRIGLLNSQSNAASLRQLGFEPVNQSEDSWRGQDPDGRWLEVRKLNSVEGGRST